MASGPLSGLRVVEMTGDDARLAGKMLTEAGASVVRVGPAFAWTGDDRPGQSVAHGGLLDWWFDGGKDIVVDDLATEAGRSAYRRLAEQADLVIESHHPGVLPNWDWNMTRSSRSTLGSSRSPSPRSVAPDPMPTGRRAISSPERWVGYRACRGRPTIPSTRGDARTSTSARSWRPSAGSPAYGTHGSPGSASTSTSRCTRRSRRRSSTCSSSGGSPICCPCRNVRCVKGRCIGSARTWWPMPGPVHATSPRPPTRRCSSSGWLKRATRKVPNLLRCRSRRYSVRCPESWRPSSDSRSPRTPVNSSPRRNADNRLR